VELIGFLMIGAALCVYAGMRIERYAPKNAGYVSDECARGWHDAACYETAIDCTCPCHVYDWQ